VLTTPVSVRIFLAAGVTNLGQGFDGRSVAATSAFGREVLSGPAKWSYPAFGGGTTLASLRQTGKAEAHRNRGQQQLQSGLANGSPG
jgi:hypothetical protein